MPNAVCTQREGGGEGTGDVAEEGGSERGTGNGRARDGANHAISRDTGTRERKRHDDEMTRWRTRKATEAPKKRKRKDQRPRDRASPSPPRVALALAATITARGGDDRTPQLPSCARSSIEGADEDKRMTSSSLPFPSPTPSTPSPPPPRRLAATRRALRATTDGKGATSRSATWPAAASAATDGRSRAAWKAHLGVDALENLVDDHGLHHRE